MGQKSKFEHGARPEGLLGLFIGLLMNMFHSGVYINFLKTRIIHPEGRLLDIGCGGGGFIQRLQKMNNIHVTGIDHSSEMVKLALKVNSAYVKKGTVEILQGKLGDLNINDESFNFVTACETVQFWEELDSTLKEVYRVLKNGGVFIIINHYPDKTSSWYEKMQIKSEDEYVQKLKKCGFTVMTDIISKPGWICVCAKKAA